MLLIVADVIFDRGDREEVMCGMLLPVFLVSWRGYSADPQAVQIHYHHDVMFPRTVWRCLRPHALRWSQALVGRLLTSTAVGPVARGRL